jgi:1,4-dihydroxy-2-naphthoate octaprenyltransferase
MQRSALMEGNMGKAVLTRPLTFSELMSNWREAILTCNISKDKIMDPVSKWLVLTRSCVFSMSLTSGLIGGLLAAITRGVEFNGFFFALSVIGLLFAHAANNLINDYFDLEVGVDSSDGYARALYAPHPIISGLVTKAQLRNVILLINLVDAAIMIYLTVMRGPLVLLFALAGLFISVFYVAPPIRLKKIGLGELGVILVWGPLMIGGTYFVTAGQIQPWVLIASLPYAILVGTVLMGKHIDKAPQDGPMGTHTLPVLLGEKNALRVNQAISVLFYLVVIFLVLAGNLSVWILLVLLSVPKLIETLKLYSKPKPAEFKDSPLYYVGVAFFLTRQAGFLFIGGLILCLFFPVTLPFKLF